MLYFKVARREAFYMKNYKRLFKIAMVFTSLGIFFMTMMFFIILVYTKDLDDVNADPTGFSQVFLTWRMWFIGMIVCYVPGISGLVYANKLKTKAREEALKID